MIILLLFSILAIVFGFSLILISLAFLSYPEDGQGNIRFLGIFSIHKPSSIHTHVKIKDFFEFDVPAPSILLLIVGLYLFVLPFFTTLKGYSQTQEIKTLQEDIANLKQEITILQNEDIPTIKIVQKKLKSLQGVLSETLDQVYINQFNYSLKPKKQPYSVIFQAKDKNQVFLTITSWSLLENATFRIIIDGKALTLPGRKQSGELPFLNVSRAEMDISSMDITSYIQAKIKTKDYYHTIKFELTSKLADLNEQERRNYKEDEIVAGIESYLVVHEKL